MSGKKNTRKVSLKDKPVSAKNAKSVKGGPIYMMPTDQLGSLNFIKGEAPAPMLGGSINFHK